MSHAELVLLALLTEGPAHAYRLVQLIRSMEVERWAAVAESTLYAVLRRLEERGFVRTTQVPGERGRPRTEYALTPDGGARLGELVREGLDAPEPVRSDRLVAAVFAGPGGEGKRIEAARGAIRQEREALESARERDDLTPRGRIIVEFYVALADAHLEALGALRELGEGRGSGTLPEVPGDSGSR